MSQKYTKDQVLQLLDELNNREDDFSENTSFGNVNSRLVREPAVASRSELQEMNTLKQAAQRQYESIKKQNSKIIEEYRKLFDSYRQKEQDLNDKNIFIQSLKNKIEALKEKYQQELNAGMQRITSQFKQNEALLQSKVNHLSYENKLHQQSLEQLKAKMAQQSSKNEAVTELVSKLKSDNEKYLKLSRSFKDQIEENNKQRQALVTETQELKLKCQTLSEKIEDKDQKFQTLNENYKTKINEKNTLHHKLLEIEAKFKNLKGSFDNHNLELKSKDDQISRLTGIIDDCKNVIEKQKDRIANESKYLTKIQHLESNLKQAHAKLEDYSHKLADSENKITEILNHKAQSEASYKQQIGKNEQLINRLGQNLNQLQGEKDQMVAKATALQSTVTTLNSQITNLQDSADEKDTEIQRLEEKVQLKTQEKAKGEEFIAKAKLDLDKKAAESQELQRKILQLQNQIDTINLDNDSLRDLLDKNKEQMAAKDKEIIEHLAAIKKFKNSISALNEANEKEEQTRDEQGRSFRQEIATLQDKLLYNKKEAQQTEAALIQVKKVLESLQQEYNQQELELEKAIINKENLKDQLDRALEKISALKAEGIDLRDAKESAVTDLQSANESLSALKKNLLKKSYENSQLNSLVEEKQSEIESLKEEGIKVKADHDSLKEELLKYRGKAHNLEESLSDFTSQLENEKLLVVTKEEQIVTLEAQKESLQSELLQYKAQTNVHKENILELESKLDQLHTLNQQMSAANHELSTDLQAEKHNLKLMKIKLEEVTGEVKTLRDERKRIVAREDKVREYKKWLDVHKAFVNDHVTQFSASMRETIHLNPISSYLKNIEAEIENLDKLLKNPDIFGSIRAYYLELQAKLKNQKQSAIELLNSYGQDVEEKAVHLELSLKSSDFIETPPLPPEDADLA